MLESNNDSDLAYVEDYEHYQGVRVMAKKRGEVERDFGGCLARPS
jgi:hypothetical protein